MYYLLIVVLYSLHSVPINLPGMFFELCAYVFNAPFHHKARYVCGVRTVTEHYHIIGLNGF